MPLHQAVPLSNVKEASPSSEDTSPAISVANPWAPPPDHNLKDNRFGIWHVLRHAHSFPSHSPLIFLNQNDWEAPSFLFESVEPNVQVTIGRYSVVGAQPVMEIVAKENKVRTVDHEFGHLTEEIIEDPMVFPITAPIIHGRLPFTPTDVSVSDYQGNRAWL
ncbi:hypothetical protein K1719_026697 [Acacia pycnantha]|nr:hypothetical protein K1719_026697 [Acacia pycnantha]